MADEQVVLKVKVNIPGKLEIHQKSTWPKHDEPVEHKVMIAGLLRKFADELEGEE